MTESQDERLGLPSASAWHRYELCAGSWQLETEARALGQSAHETSPAAERGALIHAWLAGVVDEDGTEIKLDDSEQQTADFLQERATEQVHRIFGDEPTLELAEKRLWLTVNGRKAASGRFDRVVYTPIVALVQDFKTGWSEPDPAEQNSQMKMLAVLVALNLPSMLREVVVQIISGPFGVTEARYDLAALAVAYNEILTTLRAIQDPLAPLAPSPEACRFCPAILVCQAVKNLVLPVAKIQVSALPDGARGAKLLDEVAVLEKHFKEIKKYYEKRCNADPTYRLPGYKLVNGNEVQEVTDWCYALVPGNEVREIADWKKAEMRLAEYLDTDQLKEAQSYTIGKLETALAKSLKLTAEQAKEKLNQILDGLIIRNQNKSSLKRVSGKPKLVEISLP
jgi:Protein of unknown function (DUF2800)